MREVFQRRYARGDRVRLRYGKRWRAYVGRHLQEGTIELCPGPGRGPRNYLVALESGERIVVPVGQLRKLIEESQG